MASTYSPNLRIELIGTGDQAGTWGNTTNSTDQYVLESAITGYQAVTVNSTSQALTYVNGSTTSASSNQAIFAFLRLDAGTVSANFSVYTPPNPKSYVFFNNTSYSATIYNSTAIGNTVAAGLGVTIPTGAIISVWSDGTNVRATNTQTAGNFQVNGNLTITGNDTEIGNFYAAGVFRAFTAASFTGSISGTTLTVTAVASGVLFSGMSLSGTGVSAATSTNLTNPLGTTNGSATVTVSQTAHGFTTGTPVTISGASAVGGIPATNLNGTFSITVINSGSYSYTAGATATSTVSLSGGAITVSSPQTQISGYGTGTGGNGTYTVNVPQTTVSTTITGSPAATASTPPVTDNSNNVATTAFVKSVAAQAGGFTYPSAGIPLSTGAAWNTSFTNTGNPITVPYGGTGLATLTSNGVVIGAGTATPTFVTPAGTNNVLASTGGTTWASTPFSTLVGSSIVTSFQTSLSGLTPSSSSTGAITLAGTLGVVSGGTGVGTSTGSGANVLNTSPTLVTPLLGTPTSGVLTNCTGYTYANLSGTVPTWNQNTTGNATTATTATNATNATNLTGSGNIANTTTISGVTNGTAIASGFIGEVISASVAFPTGIALTTNTTTTICSVTLTPGFWLITGAGALNQSSGSSGVAGSFITNILPATSFGASFGVFGLNSATAVTFPITNYVNISTSTTFNLLVYASFSGGAMAGSGSINAIRIR